MDFTLDELNYILNAVDTHIRAKGITGAAVGVSVVSKVSAMAKSATAPEQPVVIPADPALTAVGSSGE